jgi:hypothetical protein
MVDTRLASFPEDVTSAFGFLSDEFSFVGPDGEEEGYVGYSSDPWTIWIVLDERNKTVETFVWHESDGRKRHDAVWTLILKAKVRGAGQPRISAQKRAGVQKSLAAQAGALRLLMPTLMARGEALFD